MNERHPPPPLLPLGLLQVGIEEPVKGFSQSEDVVISIYVPYCEVGSEWEMVIDGEAPERCPDLVPMPLTEAEVGKVVMCLPR